MDIPRRLPGCVIIPVSGQHLSFVQGPRHLPADPSMVSHFSYLVGKPSAVVWWRVGGTMPSRRGPLNHSSISLGFRCLQDASRVTFLSTPRSNIEFLTGCRRRGIESDIRRAQKTNVGNSQTVDRIREARVFIRACRMETRKAFFSDIAR